MSRLDGRKRVALVTCEAFANLYEDDHLLVPALADLGIASAPAVWSDASIDWTSFDALVMRSPWDYFERPADFRAWLHARSAEGALLCNPREILDWNFDKGYLQDLARAGVAVVPTLCVAAKDKADIAALARDRGWDDIVVKPTVAGGGYRILRFRLHEIDRYAADIARTLEDRGVLVQPFLPEIQTGGELSLLFFDGVFSHAVCKRPRAGDYRVQFQFGGTNENAQVSEDLVAQAHACIEHAPAATVYARVDGVVREGRFLLMELEIFEPLMFLSRHPEAPGRFARAIEKRLRAPAPGKPVTA
jgi:glutathione synthase/RimK-type ligase-like ATP-grasp enzyme